MVPPWVPDVEAPDTPPSPDDVPNEQPPDDSSPEQPDSDVSRPIPAVPIAPRGRFGSARRSLGDYGQSGGNDRLRRGMGNYVRHGMGGSGTAARRLGSTARTASALYSTLASVAGDTAAHADARRIDAALDAGSDGRRIIDAVIEAVRPIDGTQDGEASRESIHDALSAVLDRYPDADLLKLSDDQRAFAVERFVAGDVYRRFMLDVGGAIRDRAPTAAVALSRLKEARDYIRETVLAGFRNLRERGQRLSSGRVASVVRSALREAFHVFEEYAQ